MQALLDPLKRGEQPNLRSMEIECGPLSLVTARKYVLSMISYSDDTNQKPPQKKKKKKQHGSSRRVAPKV